MQHQPAPAPSTVILMPPGRPAASPQVIGDALAVAACRAEAGAGLRAIAWRALLGLRRRHHSLAEARLAARFAAFAAREMRAAR